MINPAGIHRVLVRSPNWLGDTVMCVPALAAAKQAFPDWHLTLLAKPSSAALLAHYPAIDDTLVYQEPGVHAGQLGRLKLARELRKGEYDASILLPNSFGSALLTRFANIPIRLGYDTDARGWLLSHPIPQPSGSKSMPVTAYFLNLLRAFDVEPQEQVPMLYTTHDEDSCTAARLKAHGLGTSDLLIGINPGSVYGTAKQWSFRRYAAVADRLADSVGANIVIFGGQGEEELGANVARAMHAHPLLLSGRTTVRELMALLKRCHLLLTNDTGPMHVASALGVPVVAVFGPTDPCATAPSVGDHAIVREPISCSPCFLRACPIGHECMNVIGVHTVYDAAVTLLNRTASYETVAVFLDRDGTINREREYLADAGGLDLFPGAASAIARLNRLGVKTVVVSNQSGIGRGLFTLESLEAIHRRLRECLHDEAEAKLDAIYYCPHHHDDRCHCRKPRLGMIDRAVAEMRMNVKKSYVIGDKASDIALAANAGMKGLLVKTSPYFQDALRQLHDLDLRPHHVAENLSHAVDWVILDIRRNGYEG